MNSTHPPDGSSFTPEAEVVGEVVVYGRDVVATVARPIRGFFVDRPLVGDVIIGSVMFVLALGSNDAGYQTGSTYPWAVLPRYWVAVAVIAMTLLPIAARRRFPLSVLLIGTAGLAAVRLLHVPEYQLSSIALFLLMYSAGRWGAPGARDHARLAASVLALGVLVVGLNEERQFLSLELISLRAYVIASLVGILGNLVFIIGPWVLGDATRTRAERESDLAEANMELVASRAAAEQQAVTAERVRIARELHDVVAHHVSVMGVQAGAARRLSSTSPDLAASALVDIEASSRQAVAELHRLLGFLRSPERDGEDAPVVDTPAPGLEQLPSLQKKTAAAGLAVSLTLTGERPASLPASVDLSAYRIVQEGLTNALKHSGQQQAEVTIEYLPGSLRVLVANDGPEAPQHRSPEPSAGSTRDSGSGRNGLVGMHERVALHGGRLSVGPRPTGGFLVDAELPYDRAPSQIEEMAR